MRLSILTPVALSLLFLGVHALPLSTSTSLTKAPISVREVETRAPWGNGKDSRARLKERGGNDADPDVNNGEPKSLSSDTKHETADQTDGEPKSLSSSTKHETAYQTGGENLNEKFRVKGKESADAPTQVEQPQKSNEKFRMASWDKV